MAVLFALYETCTQAWLRWVPKAEEKSPLRILQQPRSENPSPGTERILQLAGPPTGTVQRSTPWGCFKTPKYYRVGHTVALRTLRGGVGAGFCFTACRCLHGDHCPPSGGMQAEICFPGQGGGRVGTQRKGGSHFGVHIWVPKKPGLLDAKKKT